MEDLPLRIKIKSRDHFLNLSDFHSLTPLVNTSNLPMKFSGAAAGEMEVVNSLLYYIISVIHKVPLVDFEKFIQQSISSFYLKSGMKIKVYDYSKICSDLLSVNIYECVHILHYVVYGRFASSSYVNMMVDTRGQACGEKKVDKLKVVQKKPDKIEGEKEEFFKELEDVLWVKNYEEEDMKAEKNNYNKRIMSNPYEIKLPHVEGKQTSPIINLLRKKEYDVGGDVKISRKIKCRNNGRHMSNLFNFNNIDKANQTTVEKKSVELKRTNLSSLLELKQKIKSDNQFLDQLRVTLRNSENQFRLSKSRDPIQINFERLALKEAKKEESPRRISRLEVMTMPMNSNLCEKRPSDLPLMVDDFVQSSKENENSEYRFLPMSQKSTFRSRLNVYKKEYKQFLNAREKQMSCS